jgi:hypothetical protein
MRWVDGSLYTGFKDGTLAVINSASNTVDRTLLFHSSVIAIDYRNAKMIVGLKEGLILQCDSNSDERTVLVESHYNGELWGLDVVQQTAITSGEDS